MQNCCSGAVIVTLKCNMLEQWHWSHSCNRRVLRNVTICCHDLYLIRYSVNTAFVNLFLDLRNVGRESKTRKERQGYVCGKIYSIQKFCVVKRETCSIFNKPTCDAIQPFFLFAVLHTTIQEYNG